MELSCEQAPAQILKQDFDGVICFGGVDWWYHNRGHYDLQMMREFSRSHPVLYINSIGMRAPKMSEGSMFLTRVWRKLKSIGNGLVTIRPGFTVFSPLTLPGGGKSGLGRWLARTALRLQVKYAARRCGIHSPLVWVACPPAASIAPSLRPVFQVYQRTDRFENYAGVDPERIRGFDHQLKDRSDLVLFCARELFEAEKKDCHKAGFVDHGVDFDLFQAAGQASTPTRPDPADLASISHPRVGFIGGIDAHTFDPTLFTEVAKFLPDIQFVMVGACSLPDGWCPLPNVHFLGQRPYDQVARYMAACDVLIMPWNTSEWIRACNPVKMKEYLAVGRPVVSTWFPEVDHFRDHIAIARTAPDFANAIRLALDHPGEAAARRDRVRDHSWSSKAAQVARLIRETVDNRPANGPESEA
ncbi:glycosyltransferase [Sneathiella chinensis]|uniref:Glycosyl transferase n=1 Tax=Sneathiella chinensis TaxID=349750 RepID=A0ABQ5U866_9PROT|nr:glycosyltransferase [Sneathiella chinensis]GLQ07925.1 glycosyl transferase [Sneathiella chinensis]